MRLTRLCLVLWLLGLVGCARQVPPDQARALLQKVQQARRSVALQGRLTTSIRIRGQELQSQAEVQRGPGVIHLKYTSGKFAGWQIIEQDGYVWRVSPEGTASASSINPDPGLGMKIEPSFRVSYAGHVQVAGRRGDRYVVRPPNAGRARLEVIVDNQTSYPLAMRKYASNGQLLSETTYQQIQYNTPPPQRVTPPKVATQLGPGKLGGARPTTEQDLAKQLGGPLLKPTYLPAGLQVRGYYARQGRKGLLAEIRYSDGMRTLVVAQAKIPEQWLRRGTGSGAPPQVGAPARGGRWGQWRQRVGGGQAVPGQARGQGQASGGWWQHFRGGRGPLGRSLLRERRGDRVVVVGGDLPQDELRKVLDSIPYPPGQKPGTGF